MLKHVNYDKLYLNTPVRPPAESKVKIVEHEKMNHAAELLGGISIDLLETQGLHSEIKDDYKAILSIITETPEIFRLHSIQFLYVLLKIFLFA